MIGFLETYHKHIISGFVLLVVLAGLVIFGSRLFTEKSIYNTNEYHIVFLDNNLFYFCKLEDFNDEYIACQEPYYLVRKQTKNNDGTRSERVLIRQPKEEELYQPDGAFYLNKAKIIYISKVGDKSEVLNYIEEQF